MPGGLAALLAGRCQPNKETSLRSESKEKTEIKLKWLIYGAEKKLKFVQRRTRPVQEICLPKRVKRATCSSS